MRRPGDAGIGRTAPAGGALHAFVDAAAVRRPGSGAGDAPHGWGSARGPCPAAGTPGGLRRGSPRRLPPRLRGLRLRRSPGSTAASDWKRHTYAGTATTAPTPSPTASLCAHCTTPCSTWAPSVSPPNSAYGSHPCTRPAARRDDTCTPSRTSPWRSPTITPPVLTTSAGTSGRSSNTPLPPSESGRSARQGGRRAPFHAARRRHSRSRGPVLRQQLGDLLPVPTPPPAATTTC